MVRHFHERLLDPMFMQLMTSAFGVLAADYALGLPFYGTDLLDRAGSAVRRVLISANAEAFLPPNYRDVCDSRIDKSTIRMPTLARRLLELCPSNG